MVRVITIDDVRAQIERDRAASAARVPALKKHVRASAKAARAALDRTYDEPPAGVVFRDRGKVRHRIDLLPRALHTIVKELRKDVRNGFRDGENGGYLLGQPGAVTSICRYATLAGPRAIRDATSIVLDVEFGEREAKGFGLEILGAWHTHPGEGYPEDGELSDADLRAAAEHFKALRHISRQVGWTYSEIVVTPHLLDEWRQPVLNGWTFHLGDSLDHPAIVERADVEPGAVRL